MAVVRWSAGIESVSGALQKAKESSQHSCKQMLLATHRKAATTSTDCNRLYLRDKVQRSTPLTEKELAVRNRFRAVSAMVRERAMDLSKVSADQEAFLAQRADGIKTMKAWYWDVCGKEYDQAQGA